MIQGLYMAATGMMAVETQQDVVANNIANAMTPGFRRQGVAQKGFYPAFLSALRSPSRLLLQRAPGGGVAVEQTYSDFAAGAITATGDPLNIALAGPGFIAVETPDGVRFTRNGRLGLDSGGQLVTADGFAVQSDGGGAIVVEGGAAEIDSTGNVLVAGVSVGQIRLVEFEDPRILMRQGDNLYMAPEPALARQTAAAATHVAPGSLEVSNVQIPKEMIAMLLGLRAYAANQRVITAFDDTMGLVINQVGAPV